MQKLIVLNGGKATREAFESGVKKATFETYKTKEIALHINKNLSVSFLSGNIPIDFNDSYVFTRLRATDSHFCGLLYEHFEAYNIPANDPINRSFKFSEEKITQMPRLARAGIAIPETIIAREESYAHNKEYILSHIHFPLVFKTDGSKGNNVYKIDSLQELEEKIAHKKPHALFLIQEYIENTYDTRTLVAYKKVLGSIKRTAQNNTFLNNVSQGSTVSENKLTSEELSLAIKATQVCDLDFGGVDMIHTDKGPVILEVNKSPQIKGFESVHGVGSVFKRTAEIIEELF
ncbi:MAG: ATP-grasp domain-containing protein [Candidatus Pacebacteria bacterium]|nr:ATP-grasp domain-containing protein [Candidatus Paceibacterota bacterium]